MTEDEKVYLEGDTTEITEEMLKELSDNKGEEEE